MAEMMSSVTTDGIQPHPTIANESAQLDTHKTGINWSVHTIAAIDAFSLNA
jgi:hypothetical protein